jgi:tetratricopeptide (TPR) repeat protein
MLLIPRIGSAQSDKSPRRPKMPAGADTNSARVFYDFAMSNLRKDPEKAADALYWSTRLEPTWADAYYARRIALLLSNRRRLRSYWSGDRRTIESKEIRQIDSLFYRALTLNPFVSQTLDRQLFEAIADDISEEYERAGAGNTAEIRFYIDREMQKAPTAMKAWLAYGDGRFEEAATLYAAAIKEDKRNEPLRLERARVLYQMNRLDSALAELKLATEDLRKRDKKDLVFVYQSKALAEHSMAIVNERLGNGDAARDAFGRALQEDLSYAPAHMQLAYMALETKDTTTALTEMELAAQLSPNDAAIHFIYGFALIASNKFAPAEAEFRKAVAANTDYAGPHFFLGRILEMAGKKPEALAEFRAYMAHAAKTDPRHAEAEEYIAMLDHKD